MEIVTVAHVSGFIAVAIVVSQFLLPNLLILILSSVLGRENNALTWAVAGRNVQESLWPTLLFADTASSSGVRKDVLTLSWLKTGGLILIAVAGVVTPLGLYEDIIPTQLTFARFQYSKDIGPFGNATPSRSELGLARRCGLQPRPCPGVTDPYTFTENSTGYSIDFPWGLNGSISQDRYDYFQSGLQNDTDTVSSIWDMEWRFYSVVQDRASLPLNNGSKTVVGSYRNFDMTILGPQRQLIEGLVVDQSENSMGIGLRNHSIPTNAPQGASAQWAEDLLWFEPQATCLPNNVTIDFTLGNYSLLTGSSTPFVDLRVTDRGGFANMDLQQHARLNGTGFQDSLNLENHAFIGAYISNWYTAAFFNATDRNRTFMDSNVGKTFPLTANLTKYTDTIFYDRFRSTQLYSDYLSLAESPNLRSNFSGDQKGANPNNISATDMAAVRDNCQWFFPNNRGNMSTVAIGCMMAYGAAQPAPDSDPALTELYLPGSKWTVPLYSCAMSTRASIKTVVFTQNGTGFSGVSVASVEDRVYARPEDRPTWAVEDTGIRLDSTNPVWGLVDPHARALPNTTTLQREFLHLPGHVWNTSSMLLSENMPGTDFNPATIAAASNIGTTPDSLTSLTRDFITADYSGPQNAALQARWRALSASGAPGIAQILRHVWTDTAANALVGTRSVATSPGVGRSRARAKRDPDDAPPDTPGAAGFRAVRLHARGVRYHWPFAVPAFIVLALLVGVALTALVVVVVYRRPYAALQEALRRSSAGRLAAAAAYPGDECAVGVGAGAWSKKMGGKCVRFEGEWLVVGEQRASGEGEEEVARRRSTPGRDEKDPAAATFLSIDRQS